MTGIIGGRRFVAQTIALLALSGSVSCGGGDSTGPETIAGTYTLQTVNNAALPFTTSQDATYKAEMLSWVLTLKQDNTYTGVFRGRSTDRGTTTTNSLPTNGTYTVTGSNVTLLDGADNTRLAAAVAGNSLTMTLQGPSGVLTLRFTR